MDSIIIKLGNLDSIEYINHKENKSYSFMVKSNEYFIPLSGKIDLEEELQKLKKAFEYTKGFLKIVNTKLSNEKFVQNAPKELVDKEKIKFKDANNKIEILNEKISKLSE